MKEKFENYLINILIYEGRHYALQNMDSYVLIRLVDKKKCTRIYKGTDSPYYNEYFTFEFKKTKLQKLLDNTLSFTVIQPSSCCRRKKILGNISMDLATVWEQQDHQFYHKWAVISSQDFAGGPKGYLKVDISITTIGSVPRVPPILLEDTDVIEGNLLLPEGMTLERQRANYVFKIFNGADFAKQTKCCAKEMPNIRLEILFVGLRAQTAIQRSTVNPIWNECITFTELFPPLCQRIKIAVEYVACLHKAVLAEKYVDVRYIANDNEHGFLPTYGPSYLYFYHKNAYAGRVLFSLDTVLHDESLGLPKGITRQNAATIDEKELWTYEDVLLFAAIFELSHVPKNLKGKSLSIELHFGSTMEEVQREAGDFTLSNKSKRYTPTSNDNDHYSFVDFDEEYPCLSVKSSWPDFRKRFYVSNMIRNITASAKVKMDEIEALFQQEVYYCTKENIRDKLIDVLDYLAAACRKFLDIVNHASSFVTNLDKERLQWIIREMEDIEEQAKTIYVASKRKKTYRLLTYLYKRLDFLIRDEQECYPDVFVWTVFDGKRIAHARIKAWDIVYSIIDEEKGNDCGVVKDIFFKVDSDKDKFNRSTVVCKANMYLWLGLERHKKSCFDNLPETLAIPQDFQDAIPEYLIPQKKHIFECRVYIYQGRIKPGDDSSGFSDPFIRIIIKELCKNTKVVKKSLNPLWDQTIVFGKVNLYGSLTHIQNCPPNIILEIFDKDLCFKEEYIGRLIVVPRVILSQEHRPVPKLKWETIRDETETDKGEILCATELIEVSDSLDLTDSSEVDEDLSIPEEIKPRLEKFRLEVFFWGFRQLKRIHHLPITRPNIQVCCMDAVIQSSTVNYGKNMNFEETRGFVDLYLPSESEYSPPIIIKLYDSRSFGRNTFGGIYVSLIRPFLYDVMTKIERERKLFTAHGTALSFDSQLDLLLAARAKQAKQLKYIEQNVKNEEKKDAKMKGKCKFCRYCCRLFRKGKRNDDEIDEIAEDVTHFEEYDDEVFDWWTKYYNSLDALNIRDDVPKSAVVNGMLEPAPKEETKEKSYKLKIYGNELEMQPEFNGFTDRLHVYPLFKGKRTGDDLVDNENIAGIFKGAIRVYKYDEDDAVEGDDSKRVTPTGYDIRDGAFQGWPSNDIRPFTVRVYCVKGLKLISKDKYGQTDAYIAIRLGKSYKRFRDDYVANQFNPTFGRCYELKGYFPRDHCLTVSVWDHDQKCNKDDLIGETRIDIENRFYTKHRARCGLAMDYMESGFAFWRSKSKPTQIVDKFCRLNNISEPVYTEDSVLIANKLFVPNKLEESNKRIKKECIALYALQHWNEMPLIGYHLVPEHVETRSLYHPSNPGVEQGKLEMWVDLYSCRDIPPPPAVDITPRKPVSYEFRAIIWNTEEILLNEDDFFTGERKSDIYVKGWMDGDNCEQCTDIHYRSLSGEGNFNWRFVFNFDYTTCEKKIVKARSSKFDEDTEIKYPCRLNLQVWDFDTFSKNDFLGSLTLELSRIPRAAKSRRRCTLSMLNSDSPKINLFRVRKMKGWWPFRNYDKVSNEYILAGKVEAELELLIQAEADANPAGLGRNEPQALPEPKRPEMSFSFLKNPCKALKYLCCKVYRCKLIICLVVVLIVIFVMIAFYSFPGYTIKKILGA